jgi:chromosome transmission fidelity protein 1
MAVTTSETCAYYAKRLSLPQAQLVAVPYNLLCSKPSRDTLGLTLHHNTLVLIDAAYNLPQAIASMHLSLSHTILAQEN